MNVICRIRINYTELLGTDLVVRRWTQQGLDQHCSGPPYFGQVSGSIMLGSTVTRSTESGSTVSTKQAFVNSYGRK